MKVNSKTVRENLHHVAASLRRNGLTRKYPGDELPLRSELFSADQMEQHGKTLAGSHKLSPATRSGSTSDAAGRE